ncbi:hypothetical protein SLIV_23380 [Streptomyces lividans TK24]|uniref:Secreted protein n=1 Tax=Streptomyces lividans TK24 TaxID=457428 RepID=A0ABM5R5L7_STRLI|nr:hypothetical protein SLIV_23380 [Streptomyces lividans TK24]QSJ11179.1 hypothetical protein SLIVDG2_23380 [Streptomyces lividans]QTD72089.1 hypothetical protein SLIVYQS_23380 [Streptomyces lividans TK24] [Streptomyces lividans]
MTRVSHAGGRRTGGTAPPRPAEARRALPGAPRGDAGADLVPARCSRGARVVARVAGQCRSRSVATSTPAATANPADTHSATSVPAPGLPADVAIAMVRATPAHEPM